jgi:excisionase family DNA binding protein
MTQQLDNTTRFMTVGEVAAILRVSTMTVYRLINAGQLPAVRIGRSFRVREGELDHYLDERHTKAG